MYFSVSEAERQKPELQAVFWQPILSKKGSMKSGKMCM